MYVYKYIITNVFNSVKYFYNLYVENKIIIINQPCAGLVMRSEPLYRNKGAGKISSCSKTCTQRKQFIFNSFIAKKTLVLDVVRPRVTCLFVSRT